MYSKPTFKCCYANICSSSSIRNLQYQHLLFNIFLLFFIFIINLMISNRIFLRYQWIIRFGHCLINYVNMPTKWDTSNISIRCGYRHQFKIPFVINTKQEWKHLRVQNIFNRKRDGPTDKQFRTGLCRIQSCSFYGTVNYHQYQ